MNEDEIKETENEQQLNEANEWWNGAKVIWTGQKKRKTMKWNRGNGRDRQ